jgi:hypothetical protein
VGLGTLLLAIAMLSHPRLGRIVGLAGIAVAVVLLAFNLYTFPTPPGDAGLFDAGPVVGLWYLVVSVLMLRAMPWVRAACGGAAAPTARGASAV